MKLSISLSRWRCIEIILFWCVLQNMMFWPTSFYSFRSIFSILGIFLILSSKYLFNYKTKASLLILITLLIICDSLFLDGIKTTLAVSSSYILGIHIFCLNDNYKQQLLNDTSRWLAYILCIGSIMYVAWLIIPYPEFNVLSKPYGYQDHYNHIFFLRPTAFVLIPRYSGPFVEPGHLGMIGVFILYANQFNFKQKKYLWSILISVLLSLSLAGYVLLFFALILNYKLSIKYILLSTIILSFIYIISTEFWGEGDNPINTTIFERLKFDEEKGISGNNRNFNYTEEYFSKMCEDNSIIWGFGFDRFMNGLDEGKIGGAGIMVFLMQYGIIGTLLVLGYYLNIALNGANKKFAFGFFVLIIICFLQRAYPTWIAWLLPYISSILLYHKQSINTDDESKFICKKPYTA